MQVKQLACLGISGICLRRRASQYRHPRWVVNVTVNGVKIGALSL